MKRLLILVFILSTTLTASAQFETDDREIFAGVGYMSGKQLFRLLNYNKDVTVLQRTHGPVLHFGFNYVVKKGVRIGLTFAQHSYKEVSNRKYVDYGLGTYTIKEDYYYDAASCAAEMKIDYVNKKYFQMYGTMGIGCIYYKGMSRYSAGAEERFSKYDVSVCFMPVGMRIGNTLAGFVEAGLGYKGIVNAGFSFKFGDTY